MSQRPSGGKQTSAAEACGIYYILMNKKDRLVALYKSEAGGEKVAQLLSQDFGEKKQ